MNKYRAFFVTVAARCGVPDELATGILHDLSKRCDEIDYVPEQHESGKMHMHLMMFTKKAVVPSNLKRTVVLITSKYIPAPDVKSGVVVRVIKDTQAVVDYMQKQSDMTTSFEKLKAYVEENFGTAQAIIEANALYKANQIRYAYDNWSTWKDELDWTAPVRDIWCRFNHLRLMHCGKSPTTAWKLEDAFASHMTRAGRLVESDHISTLPKRFRFEE